MPNIAGVACTAQVSGTGTIYTVEITAFPALPYQNNIFNHNGNPGIAQFSCDISQVTHACTKPVFRTAGFLYL